MKKAFITGITGQDGSYLAEFLIEKGYEVHSIIRRSSLFNTARIDHILNNERLKSYHGDLCDSSNLNRLLSKIKPDEIYNLGAQSHVAVSFEVPEYTAEVNALGTIRLLDAIRELGLNTKLYQASTSELFGGLPQSAPQSEKTPFTPRSPYAIAKLYSYWMVKNYRDSFNIFASNGILFNHESPRRGETFVTKKITKAAARISLKKQNVLKLGNLNAMRDWGYAKEYVECMWLILQQDIPDDFVIGTGVMHSVKYFVEKAFKYVNIDIVWDGNGVDEKGYIKETGELIIMVDPRYYRPSEVEVLCADPTKSFEVLGWKPKTKLDDLIKIMVEYDLKNERFLNENNL